ncbi:hypothetical protein M407DRAFT_177448 [Tulasnella calospora MUT 4182]|uniref:Uncharacterized protein n=1 Tax=Tulasnella calospora MUT 4182 TaxID=1051891 RepID=A0A0C3QVQ3_9AGAM|nr:hypothetical protein M407DRAFT_177448 [Tulasnella calospora MUT 4182]
MTLQGRSIIICPCMPSVEGSRLGHRAVANSASPRFCKSNCSPNNVQPAGAQQLRNARRCISGYL